MTSVGTTSVGTTSVSAVRSKAVSGTVSPLMIYLLAIVLFAAIGVLLSGRMAAGEDPALGLFARPLSASTQPAVVRKVVLTRRIRIDGMTAAEIRRRGVDRVLVVRRRAPAGPGMAQAVAGGAGPAAPTTAPQAPGTLVAQEPRRSSGSRGANTVTVDSPASAPGPATAPLTPTAAPVASAPAPAATPAPAAAPATPTPAPAPAPVATTTS